ncbi:MAG TPA: glycosyltransferase family A protein [Myxococcota bacterium]|nr:glycosyltransferase family A protein [Myxococcota bacterium]
MAESEPALTVAICTRNRCEPLLRALASLAAQQARAAWEVLVVENASDDDTRSAAAALAGDFPVPLAVASEPARGLSHARNRALRAARGRAVVYLDDDATCRAGWVAAHADGLAGSDVVATGGPVSPVLPHGLAPEWRAFLEREDGGPTARYDGGPEPRECGPGGAALPYGCNFGVARAEALAAGGFRTDLGWGVRRIPGEESELLRRLSRRGRILYLPGAAIDHHIDAERVTPANYLAWYRGHGRALARLDPPANRGAALVRAAHQLARALAWAARAQTWHARRAREVALGQALELLRSD